MAITPFETFLEAAPEPQRSTLHEVRSRVHALFPDIEECMSYGIAAFRLNGIVVAGIAPRKAGCSWYPMSGSLLNAFDVGALGYTRTSGALHFAADTPLPKPLIRKLIKARLALG